MPRKRFSDAKILLVAAIYLIAPCEPRAVAGQGLPVNRLVLQFDAGPKDSAIDASAIRLGLESAYSPETGFGWTQAPQHEFIRRELSQSRTALTIDGVAGPRLAFRADVAAGTWHLLLWVDAAPSNTGQVRLFVQGIERETGWRAIAPEEEPHPSVEKSYRVFCGTASVGADGLSVELVGQGDDVRLLGLTLIRQAEAASPEDRELSAKLAAAGKLSKYDAPGRALGAGQAAAAPRRHRCICRLVARAT